jgi:hypothetical protein
MRDVESWVRVRQVVNVVNLSTLLGLLIAVVGRADVRRGPSGLLLATGYRLRIPAAVAFTVGNVVLTRLSAAALAARPRLLAHEARHSTQWALCLGPVFLPLYGVAALWSRARAGDFATGNVFERRAGLVDGGYVRATSDQVIEGQDEEHG